MNFGILGTKLGMTQIFDASGLVIPVTIIKAGPCTVTQVKTVAEDGYNSIQLGYLPTRESLLSKPILGHLRKSGAPALKYLREFPANDPSKELLGSRVSIDGFAVGNSVSISGKTIGKGFAGTVKKHNFTRGPMTHGSKNHREPGSIGMGTTPGRVYPGKRMAGRLGGKKATMKNLQVVLTNVEDDLLVVKGSVPGKPGSLLRIWSHSK
jgi:large subunit ribosomal protein L3